MVYDSSGNSVTCNYDLGRSVIDEEKDLFLGGGILFAACVLFLVMNLMQYVQAKESGQKENQEKQVVIKVDGEVYGRYSLDEDQVIEVQEGDFYNRVRIEDGKAYMEEADCPDGYCEEQGKINNRSQTIVCLPHKLVVEIEEVENSDDSQNEKEHLPDTISK